MMLYKSTKVKVRSLDGDTDLYDIAAGVLQGDKLAPTCFIICQDYMLRTSIDLIKEISFQQEKERNRRYPAQNITDVDHTDDIALLASTLAQAESHLHSRERSAGGIGLHVNADTMEYMCLNQRGDIFTLKSGPAPHQPKMISLFN